MYGTCFLVVALAAQRSRAATFNVTIDATPRQTLTSFGASGAWWPNDLIHFPKTVQQRLGDFLFSEDGLYLSSYRYNMGGDGGNDSREVTVNGSRVESFLLRDGTYDWSRDQAGVTFLQMAQKYAVPYITFFINAAPSHIASNGAACGWNMTADKVGEFADYIDIVLSHWTEEGINIKYISPMNEPDNARYTCTQEGMGVSPSLRADVIRTLRERLNGRNSSARSVGIIADETSQITTQAFPEDPTWLPAAAPYMAHIAVHNYDYPSNAALHEYYRSIRNLTTASDFPPIKFTETCCSTTFGHGSSVFGAQYDPDITNALIVAQYVWQFLTIVQAESFDWWTAVTNLPCSPTINAACAEFNATNGYNSGLVYIDPNYNQTHDYSLYTTKRAYLMKHLAYFHRPGSVRYDVPHVDMPIGVHVFASKLADDGGPEACEEQEGVTWSIFFANHRTETVDINLQAPTGVAKVAKVVETTNTTDWDDVQPLPALKNGIVAFLLPAMSIVTLQLST